jgi:hypothetical protein
MNRRKEMYEYQVINGSLMYRTSPDGDWKQSNSDIHEMASVIKTLDYKVKVALELIERFGGTDGAHHKQWLIDQILRALTGNDYVKWVAEWESGAHGPKTYFWDDGIAP